MSSIVSPKHCVIRVKRRADEDKPIPNKRCKFVGTTDSLEDKDIYQLLESKQLLPQSGAQEDQKLSICDYEEVFESDVLDIKSDKPKQIITCNGEPLEVVENQLDDSFDYLYDIYVFENIEELEVDNRNEYREYEESDEDSNDENYAYNDYPDEQEVPEDVIDYYNYTEDLDDSQRDLRIGFKNTNISSDYDSNDDEIDAIDRYYRKNRDLDDSDEEEKEEEEEDQF